MKRLDWRVSAIIAVLVLILMGGYRWVSHKGEQILEKKTGGSVALVKTIPIRKGTITEDIAVYGVAIPAPGALRTVSIPFESRVRKVMVSTGQKVSPGDVLMEIESSPDTHLQFEQARNTLETAKQSLEHFQRLFDLKLATNDQLIQSKQAFEQARLNLESMKKRGIDSIRQIRADEAGLISKVSVQEGTIVPAGGTLVEMVVQNLLEVRLGVEPEDINKVQPNQRVLLSHVNVPVSDEVMGRIRKISSSINPSTRLVDVFVALPPSSGGFFLNEYVLGKITVASLQGLIVPRSAVLPEDGRFVLFTVKNDRALKRIVKVGLENEKEVEVIGTGLQPGDPVVVLGNYELKDGVSVKVEVSQ